MPERVCRNVGRTGRDGLVGLESAILRKPWTSQEEGYRGDSYRAAASWLGVLQATNRARLVGMAPLAVNACRRPGGNLQMRSTNGGTWGGDKLLT